MEKRGMTEKMGPAFDGKVSQGEALPKERESAGQAAGAEALIGSGAEMEKACGSGTEMAGKQEGGIAMEQSVSGAEVTREELGQLYFLQQEIEGQKRRIKELRNTLKSPALSGMPRGGGVSDPVARTVELIEGQQEILLKSVQECLERQNRLLGFIGQVEDARIRLILQYRHLEGLNWVQVAHRMNVTPESVKMAYKRFFDGRKGIQ